MSSLLAQLPVLGNSVAFPHPFTPEEASAIVRKQIAAVPKLGNVTPASRLEVRPVPEMVSSGIAEVDALCGGLPRGCLTEIYGAVSSGRTCILLSALAAATRRQEVCALVDATDALNPLSASAAGVDLSRLLWVRCAMKAPRQKSFLKGGHEKNDREKMEGPLDQVLRVTDLLLQSGGFGIVAIDLGDVAFTAVRRIPLTSWFRFQRAVENTSTVLLVIDEIPCARTCASLLVRTQSSEMQSSAIIRQLSANRPSADSGQLSSFGSQLSIFNAQQTINSHSKEKPSHTELFEGLQVEMELMRSRLERKPAQSVNTSFASETLKSVVSF